MKIEYMNRKKTIIIIIVIAIVAIAIPLAIYTVSPLFFNTEINEPLPTLSMETMMKRRYDNSISSWK